MSKLTILDCTRDIQNLLLHYYDDTKRILIASEEIGGAGVEITFGNILEALDQIYLILKNPNRRNLNRRLKIIKANFIMAQNYALTESIINITNFKFNITKTDKKKLRNIQNQAYQLLYNKNIIYIEKVTKKINFSNLLDLHLNLEKINEFIEINNELRKHFTNAINIFLPEWIIGKGEGLINRPLENEFLQKFFQIILEVYSTSRFIIIDIMYRMGGHYWFIKSEYRDALDHIARALTIEKCNPMSELTNSAEHMRRAAMESIQMYLKEELDKFRVELELQNSDKIYLSNLMKYQSNICCARYYKANDSWYNAVRFFYKITDELDKRKKIEKDD